MADGPCSGPIAKQETVMNMMRAGMLVTLLLASTTVLAEEAAKPAFDAVLAAKYGADDFGMRSYVLVVLKTGPNKMAAGPARDEMFRGHFANIQRLAAEGKLAFAGPLDGVDGWRGLFVFAVKDIEEAKALAATDPVLINGEMVAEYHRLYGSAGLMGVLELHERVKKKEM
jgi:uncharacterized protein YciI